VITAIEKQDLLVFANIVIGTSLLIYPSKALKSRVRLVLLIHAPADSLVLEQVDHSRHIFGNLIECITV